LARQREDSTAKLDWTFNSKLAGFIAECNQSTTAEADMATMEKKGMPTGMKALHPISGEPICSSL